MPRAPVLIISHGGGPLPLLSHPSQTALTHSLRTTVPRLLHLGTPAAPRAILIITAHWETPIPTISGGATHSLYYDYYGFPPAMYDLDYPAPGSPAVAKEVYEVFEQAGLKAKIDTKRGWDHGVFVPFMLINPAADIPLVQMSVLPAAGEDIAALYAMGRALTGLRERGIAIVGSGLPSVHNLKLIRAGPLSEAARTQIAAFSARLSEVMALESVQERGEALQAWRGWEGADLAHPRGMAEHFFPAVVCAGAGGEEGAKMWMDEAMGCELVSYYWE